jgi:hypothetical protein
MMIVEQLENLLADQEQDQKNLAEFRKVLSDMEQGILTEWGASADYVKDQITYLEARLAMPLPVLTSPDAVTPEDQGAMPVASAEPLPEPAAVETKIPDTHEDVAAFVAYAQEQDAKAQVLPVPADAPDTAQDAPAVGAAALDQSTSATPEASLSEAPEVPSVPVTEDEK